MTTQGRPASELSPNRVTLKEIKLHYYKRNIGDYAKKAARLTMLQHGAYTLLLDSCYDRETFPTKEQAIDWCWASSQDEIDAVEFVLTKFFTLEDGVYIQERVFQDLDKYHQNAKINKRIAIEREAKRKENDTKRAPCVNASPPSLNEPPPNHKPLTTNHKPLTNNKHLVETNVSTTDEPIADKQKNCPHMRIIDIYHQKLPELGRIAIDRWKGSKRENWLQARWRESEKHQDLEFWEWYFSEIKSLSGGFYVGNNDRTWKPNLEWLVKRENFDKMIDRIISERPNNASH